MSRKEFEDALESAAIEADERWSKDNYDSAYCTVSYKEGAAFGHKYAMESKEVMGMRDALKFYQKLTEIPLDAIVHAYQTQGPTYEAFYEYTRRAREALKAFDDARKGETK